MNRRDFIRSAGAAMGMAALGRVGWAGSPASGGWVWRHVLRPRARSLRDSQLLRRSGICGGRKTVAGAVEGMGRRYVTSLTSWRPSRIIFPVGAVAQLGERVPRTDEVRGSNPLCSTKTLCRVGRASRQSGRSGVLPLSAGSRHRRENPLCSTSFAS